jgi:hypothetical protein
MVYEYCCAQTAALFMVIAGTPPKKTGQVWAKSSISNGELLGDKLTL